MNAKIRPWCLSHLKFNSIVPFLMILWNKFWLNLKFNPLPFGLCCSMQRSLHSLHAFWISVWRLKSVSEFSLHLNSIFGLDSGGQNLLYFCLFGQIFICPSFSLRRQQWDSEVWSSFSLLLRLRLFCQHRFLTSDALRNLKLKF